MTENGKAEEMKGRVKEAAGDLLDNDELQREGKLDQGSGKLKQKVDDAKDAIDDGIDKVTDRVRHSD